MSLTRERIAYVCRWFPWLWERNLLALYIFIYFAISSLGCRLDKDVEVTAEDQIEITRDYPDLPTDVKIGNRYPSFSEKEITGFSQYLLEPDSYHFQSNLIYYDNPKILFKGDEHSELRNHNSAGEEVYTNPKENWAHYMYRSIIRPLENLVILLESYDPQLRVRVTSAFRYWPGQNYRYSLHHQGRALDLTLYDLETESKALKAYSKLYTLCIEAGFDWVFYEDAYHVHVSHKAEGISDPLLVEFSSNWYRKEMKKGYEMLSWERGQVVQRSIPLQVNKTYSFQLSDGNRVFYGFRGQDQLGRSDFQGVQLGYVNQVIEFQVAAKGVYDLTFWPDELRFSIDGPGAVEYINNTPLGILLHSIK